MQLCFQVKNIKVGKFTFADKSNALGVVGSVRKMDKDAEETVTVRLRTAVDHSGTGGVGSAALPVIVPQERSAGTEKLAIYVVNNITNLCSKSPIQFTCFFAYNSKAPNFEEVLKNPIYRSKQCVTKGNTILDGVSSIAQSCAFRPCDTGLSCCGVSKKCQNPT